MEKSKSTQLLNAAKDFMVDFANEKGINLADEFGTPEKFKEFVIAFTFKTLRQNGFETKEAFDIVFGDNAYEQLASDVWRKARGEE